MLVKNILPTVLDFGCPNGTTLKDPGGKNHGVKIPGMSLIPGNNEVPKETWETWTTGRAKCAGLDWHLAKKNLEVVKVEVEAPDKDGQSIVRTVSAEDFAGLNAGDAIGLVKETFDMQMLSAWHRAEREAKDRSTVLDAIKIQGEMLEAQASDTDGE